MLFLQNSDMCNLDELLTETNVDAVNGFYQGG